MAPRRKQQETEPREQGREVKLRLPESIMKFIEERAKADRRPINKTIITLLTEAPGWEHMTNLDDLSRRYEAMLNMAEVSFARYSSEIARQVLTRRLVNTLDMFLQTGLELELDPVMLSWFNELRVIRAEMRNQESQERIANPDRTTKR